jgi:hypothetical protein
MSSFSFTGTYHAHDCSEALPSMLCGRWSSSGDVLDDGIVGAALRAHPQWAGGGAITLRPALVTAHSAMLACSPDVLYERERFTPTPGTPPLPADMLDLRKAQMQWKLRQPHVAAVLSGRTHAAIMERLHDVDAVIINRALVHRAGHMLGYDVRRKHADGYFSASGRTAWPLIHLEELRAELHGLGFAVALLPPEQAVNVLLYDIAFHFGVHRERLVSEGVAPHGLVPFLLFSLLRELGVIVVTETDPTPMFRLATLDTPWLYRVMLMCADHAQTRLTAPELATADPLRRALCAARYVRERLCDGLAVETYSRVMQPSSVYEQQPGPRALRAVSRAASSA